MKLVSLLSLASLGLAFPLLGQSYNIDWFTIDGGGGSSSGGNYTINGTIGQSDAGQMSGGHYTLVGGFWGGITLLQTPGAPLLAATAAGGGVVISWRKPAANYILEQTSALTATAAGTTWLQVDFPYQTNATHISITVPAPAANKVYRLRRL